MIKDQEIIDVINNKTKSRKEREREAVDMVRQQQRQEEQETIRGVMNKKRPWEMRFNID